MKSDHSHDGATVNDTFFETFVAAGSGGGVIVFFFLVLDLIAGQVLATPSLAGQVILGGATPMEATGGIEIGAVANMTVLHLAAFALLGFVASKVVRGIEAGGVQSPLVPAMVIFLLLQVPALVASVVVWPELGTQIGHGAILTANLLAAPTMTMVLRASHATAARAPEARVASSEGGHSVAA